MTDRQAADQIIADIFDPPTSRCERELAERIGLLEK